MSARRLLIVLIVCVLAGMIAYFWLSSPPARPREQNAGHRPTSPLDPAIAEELIAQLNVGVAYLENDKYADAIRVFSELSPRVPDELAPVRNLMVAHLLNLEAGDAAFSQGEAALEKVEAALSRLETLDPNSFANHILAGRLLNRQGHLSEAMGRIQAATTIRPDDLPTWFELYTMGQYATEELREQALSALKRSFELAPTNLAVLLEWLIEQTTAQDPTILATLDAGNGRWEQLAPGVQTRSRTDLLQLVESAREAVKAGEWNVALLRVRGIRNVLIAEEATRSDRRRAERHSLEFVLDQFSPELVEAAREAGLTEVGPPIAFAAADAGPQRFGDGSVTSIVACDADLDSVDDLACVRDGRFEVWRQVDDGWSLMMDHDAGMTVTRMLAIDLDDDVQSAPKVTRRDDGDDVVRGHKADLDFVLFGDAGVMALQNVMNENGRKLVPIDLPEELASAHGVRTLIPGDLDMDGDLDLLLLTDAGVSMWSNRGNLSFSEDGLRADGVPAQAVPSAALPIDWDGDIDLDVVVCTDDGVLGLLENLQHGEFQWRELSGDVGQRVAAIEPIDRDGTWDLLLAGDGGLKRVRTKTEVIAKVDVTSVEEVDSRPLSRVRVEDLNNDGLLDAIGWNADGIVTFPGAADAAINGPPTPIDPALLPRDIAAVDVADVNSDGRLDVVVGGTDGARLLVNSTDPSPAWIDVSLVAEQIKGDDAAASGRVNHLGIGSIVELRDGLRRQRQIVRRPVVHFGVGDHDHADAIRITWTNGVPENVIEPDVRTFISERQTLKTSCPYLYGWDGRRFAFITDLLWAAPLGLVNAQGTIVPDRPWEYLKIDGSQLQSRDGRYELRLTEELWEAVYLDSVRLFAVDHPAGTDIFTNEKVGPPSIAEHRIHTVSGRRLPVSAIDQQGRDVLPLIARQDEQYVRLFDRKLRQGYTEPTTLELDLGKLGAPQQITLFLTGWIYPTDTTINVALSQNPDLPGPEPPSLAVPDESGESDRHSVCRISRRQDEDNRHRPFRRVSHGRLSRPADDESGALLGRGLLHRRRCPGGGP